MDFITAHWVEIVSVLGLVATLGAGLVTGKLSLILRVVGEVAKAVVALFGKKAPPAETVGEQIAREQPVITPPAAGTPAATLKTTLDAKLARKLGDDLP